MIDETFKKSMEYLHFLEGGISDNPYDLGGYTKYGISLRFLKLIGEEDGDFNNDGHVTKEDLNVMSYSDAVELYHKYFWNHYKIDIMPFNTVIIKSYLLTMYVNLRGRVANRTLQRAIKACGINIIDDGVIGPRSLKAMDKIISHNYLLPALKAELSSVYRNIVRNNSSQQEFINGWLNRAYMDYKIYFDNHRT